jgi:uncharacterized RDD family membrane protein YckC
MKQPIETSLRIDTPENVAFQYKVAGIGSRFLAALIDTIFITLIQIFLIIIILLIWSAQTSSTQDTQPSTWLIAFLGFLASFVLGGYYIFFEIQWNGKSPGKRIVGLQVIRNDGTSITLTESLIRNLIRLVDFLPANYAIGVLTMFIDAQSRRLGDMAAGTLVILEQSKVTLESLEKATRIEFPHVPQTLTATWPINRLNGEDLELIERFLQRREQLSNRSALAMQILNVILEKMDLPKDQVLYIQAEAALLEIAAVLRVREG